MEALRQQGLILILNSPDDERTPLSQQGFCVERSKLRLTSPPYTIPGLTDKKPMVFDRQSYRTLQLSSRRVFVLDREQDPVIVVPLSNKCERKFEQGQLKLADLRQLIDRSRRLGAGTYGVVFSDDYRQAVTKKSQKEFPQDFIREIAFYSLLQSTKCLPGLYDWNLQPYREQMTMEQGLVLSDVEVPPERFHDLCHQLVQCLWTFNSQGVIHGDLKTANTIVSPDLQQAQIIDFGLAQLDRSHDSNQPHIPLVYTADYRAPEVFENNKYDYRADIFALGLIMLNVTLGADRSIGWERGSVALALYPPDRKTRQLVFDDNNEAFNALQERGSQEYQRYVYFERRTNYRSKVKKALQKLIQPKYPRRTELIDLLSGMLLPHPNNRWDWPRIARHRYWTAPFMTPSTQFVGEMNLPRRALSLADQRIRADKCQSIISHCIEFQLPIAVCALALNIFDQAYWPLTEQDSSPHFDDIADNMADMALIVARICREGDYYIEPEEIQQLYGDLEDFFGLIEQLIDQTNGRILTTTAFDYYDRAHRNTNQLMSDETPCEIMSLFFLQIYSPRYHLVPVERVWEFRRALLMEVPNEISYTQSFWKQWFS